MRDPRIERQIRKVWRPRPKRANKKDFGRVFILAGSRGLTGAAALASFASLRAGAGLVTLGCPDKVYTILARRHPEVMVRPFPSTPKGTLSEKGLSAILNFLKSQDVLAIGPGLGRHPNTGRLVRNLLLRSSVPSVVDADGVNALQGQAEILRDCKSPLILTPHPGEFVRTFGGKKPVTDKERKKRALEVSRKIKQTLVLKGYRTVVAGPTGKVAINPTGNPGMATGGTGDVLTGIIAALLGQGISPFDSACFGVYIHGLAGDIAAKEKGEVSLVAGDIVEFLPKAIHILLA
ncbi:MAG: NAD(P)H-hydrate dehydratase [Candidatus Omnitrophica bacterium]|nr:NAD(P)H-hydrate dehydratase [Candidatus Omnitrophota bacterium]